jgi:hypothetical protein
MNGRTPITAFIEGIRKENTPQPNPIPLTHVRYGGSCQPITLSVQTGPSSLRSYLWRSACRMCLPARLLFEFQTIWSKCVEKTVLLFYLVAQRVPNYSWRFRLQSQLHHLGYLITGGGSVTQEPPFCTITVPLPFVSVSVAAICRVTAFGYPDGRVVVPVALRDCPAASGTEFSETLKSPRRRSSRSPNASPGTSCRPRIPSSKR